MKEIGLILIGIGIGYMLRILIEVYNFVYKKWKINQRS